LAALRWSFANDAAPAQAACVFPSFLGEHRLTFFPNQAPSATQDLDTSNVLFPTVREDILAIALRLGSA
jgi:hypothetical protein